MTAPATETTARVAEVSLLEGGEGVPARRGARALRGTWAWHLLVWAVIVAAWQVVYLAAGADAFAPPGRTISALVGNIPGWWPDLQSTLLALLISLAGTVVIGVGLGFLLGLSPFWSEVFRPLLFALYSIPKVAIYPIFLLVLKVSFSTLILFAIFHGILPVIILVMEGTRAVPAIQLKVAECYRLSFLRKVWFILLPSVRPVVAEAVRMGASLTFLGLVIAEMFGSNIGLGNRLVAYLNLNQTQNIFAVFLLICIVGLALSVLTQWWQRRVERKIGLV